MHGTWCEGVALSSPLVGSALDIVTVSAVHWLRGIILDMHISEVWTFRNQKVGLGKVRLAKDALASGRISNVNHLEQLPGAQCHLAPT